MPANVSQICKYVDVKCFPLRMELQDTTLAARVSGGTADQDAPYHQMIAFHLLHLRLRVKVRVQRNLWKYPNCSISCFDRRHQNKWLMTCSFTSADLFYVNNKWLLGSWERHHGRLSVVWWKYGRCVRNLLEVGHSEVPFCAALDCLHCQELFIQKISPRKLKETRPHKIGHISGWQPLCRTNGKWSSYKLTDCKLFGPGNSWYKKP